MSCRLILTSRKLVIISIMYWNLYFNKALEKELRDTLLQAEQIAAFRELNISHPAVSKGHNECRVLM